MRRLAVFVVLGAIIAGGAAIVFTGRPALSDARDETEATWAPILPRLEARYAQLDLLGTQLQGIADTTGIENPEVRQLAVATLRWNKAVEGGSAVSQVKAANDLETRMGRMRLLVAGSARLAQAIQIQATFDAFDAEAPPADEVAAYNDAVRSYQRTREEALRRPVAEIFGFGPIPTLELTPTG